MSQTDVHVTSSMKSYSAMIAIVTMAIAIMATTIMMMTSVIKLPFSQHRQDALN